MGIDAKPLAGHAHPHGAGCLRRVAVHDEQRSAESHVVTPTVAEEQRLFEIAREGRVRLADTPGDPGHPGRQIVQRLFDDVEDDPTTEVTVDLIERQVRWSGEVHGFDLDGYTRWRLLEGLDDIGLTLRHTDAIAAHGVTVLFGGYTTSSGRITSAMSDSFHEMLNRITM